jgi:hypothetical protein
VNKLANSRWLGWLAAFGLLLLSRPYLGIYHDGRLYVADALAKLDPGGVGRDLMFVHDGQFGFSLYTPMLARLIAVLGPSGGTMAIVAVTLVLWFAAAALMIERFLADRSPALRWAALVFVVALPSLYGPLNVIGFGEAYATPRGLVEAAGLAGMAAYLSGRRWLGLALCVAGMLFHPIMGLCSAAAIGIALCLEDRRWLWAGLAGVAVFAVAGLAHLPVADRLVTIMDPEWRAVVEARSPFLFPSLWPIEAWSRLAVQACTVAAAAFLLQGASRRLALGALIAGLVGVAIVAVLGDRLSLILFLQVQSWRTLQPLAVLALACLALLSAELPRRGPAGLLGLALIGVAWMFRDVGALALLAAPLGLVFVAVGDRVRFSRPALISAVTMGLLAVAVVACAALTGSGLISKFAGAGGYSQATVWFSDFPGLIIAVVLGVWLARGWTSPPAAVRIVGALVLALLAILLWDDRSAYIRARDQGRDRALVAMTASRPGEVLWLNGDVEPWVLMGRPSWSATVQSAGVVFSRPLALELWRRAKRLERAGLVGRDSMKPLTVAASRPPPPHPDKVRAFCAAPDAPAWIVWPRWTDQALPPGVATQDWTPKAPFHAEMDDGRLTAERYAVIPCAGD